MGKRFSLLFRTENPAWAVLVGVLWIAWSLLLSRSARQDVWIDEWYTVQNVHTSWPSFLPQIMAVERRPPLYYAFLKLWVSWAGDHEYVLATTTNSLRVVPSTRMGSRPTIPGVSGCFHLGVTVLPMFARPKIWPAGWLLAILTHEPGDTYSKIPFTGPSKKG
jgi:hypothetical protein